MRKIGSPNLKKWTKINNTFCLQLQICDLTNKNAAYKIEKGKFPKGYGNWKTLAKDELKAFYAVRTFIELYCKDRITSIWRKTRAKHYLLHTPGPAIIFSKNRYKQICALLHYCDETQAKARDDPEYDRLFKVRKLTDFLKTKFKQYYNPSQNISVDECMIPVRGHKPVKWGVKVWMLCDSETGYNLNFDVYCGKDPDFEHVNNIGLVSGVVLKLCQIYFGKGHTVYTDRFYTSPTLLHLLHKVDLLGCGTVMTNREHFPKQLIKKESECKIQGESEWLQCSKTGIVATRWTDKRPIYFLSNAHVASYPDCTVQRTDKKGNKLTVPATPSVVEYNKYMGGVDLNDKMSRLDKSRKTYKWYARIDKKGIMWAMFNAYVLYKHIHKDADYRKFQLDVIHGLIDGNTFIARIEPNEPSTSSMARLHGKSHTPVLNASASSNNRCVVCREKWKHARLSQSTVNQVKAAKTKYQCRDCDVYICIKIDSTCWADYHSKEHYWL